MKSQFIALMSDAGKISVPLNRNLRFAEMGRGDERALWMLLLSSGYLKARAGESFIGNSLRFELSIPNEEVRHIYNEIFYKWLVEKSGSVAASESLINQMIEGKVELFCQNLEAYFMSSVSTHDVRTDTAESFYHGFLLGFLALAKSTLLNDN